VDALQAGVSLTDIATDLDRPTAYIRRVAQAQGHSTPAPAKEATVAPQTAQTNVDAVAIAQHLRTLDTMEAGAAYLQAQQLNRAGLLAVATEAGLSRIGNVSLAALQGKILKQTISARKKFAGLRHW
jgi:hypothetical protein